ncbi:MAG: iron complex outermembrane receptor protein [Colwellia sp.]|jgi:iron complex outermembrane receptor protein
MKTSKPNFKLSKIAIATSSIILASLTMAEALAQEEVLAQTEIEVIEVRGIRSSIVAGLDLKRDSTNIVDAVSAEDMGKFPDANLAEALQRIPDISIDRDGGEGRKVTIRGMGPEFNSVLLNGRKVASSEATRSFSFDTIASELVSEMVVYKTQSAALSEGAIGGTIDVKTARPLNFDGLNISGTLQAGYEENAETTNPQGSLLISNTFMEGKFGALFGASYQKRENTTYKVGTGSLKTLDVFLDPVAYGYSNYGFDPLFRPDDINRSVVNDDRERLGLNAVLQYRPNDKLDVTVDFLYSKFDVLSSTNTKSSFFWDVHAPTFPGGAGTVNADDDISGTIVDANGVVTNIEHGLTGIWGESATAYNRWDRVRDTETKMLGINVDYMINDDIKLVVDAAYSSAVDDNKGRTKRRSTEVFIPTDEAIALGSKFNVDLTRAVPFIENIESFSATNPDLADNLELRSNLNNGVDINAENYQFTADFIITSIDDLTINTGFAYEVSQKSNDDYRTPTTFSRIYSRARLPIPAGSLDTIVGSIIKVDSSDLGQPSHIDNDILEFDVPAFTAVLEDPANVLAASIAATANGRNGAEQYQAFLDNGSSWNAVKTGNGFEIEETVTSVYVEGEYSFLISDIEATLIAGVRYTQTDLDATGFSQVLTVLTPVPCPTNAALTCLEPTFADANGPGGLTKQVLSNSYSDVLPSATLNLNLTDDLILRLAASKSMTRPFLEDLAPKFKVETLTEDARTAETNNENLNPYSSFNLDASLEWYFAEGSMASIAVYSKDISDFVTKETINDVIVGTVDDPDFQDFTVRRPTNGTNDIGITGATFNLVQTFESGFGYQFNFTIVDTDTDFDPVTFDSSKAALPGLGNSMNLVGFYEEGPFSARVAYNKRDSFLRNTQFGSGNGTGTQFDEPVFSDDYDQVDARVSYEILDGTTIFLEGVNLTESTLNQHGRYDNLFISYENFGRRYVAGISAAF